MLGKWFLLRLLGRSLVLQASWNYERLQALGFLYVVLPALRVWYRDDGQLLAACQRHTAYFNTHPYMSSLLIGAALRLEEDMARKQEVLLSAEDFKKMAMAPFSAMGDAFFWGAVRPAAAIVALFFAAHGSLTAPFVFLALYNLPHLFLRTAGLFVGYGRGTGVVEFLQRLRLADAAVRLKEAGIVLLGGFMALLTWRYLQGEAISQWWGLGLLPLLFLLLLLVRRGLSVPLLILVGTVLILVLPNVL